MPWECFGNLPCGYFDLHGPQDDHGKNGTCALDSVGCFPAPTCSCLLFRLQAWNLLFHFGTVVQNSYTDMSKKSKASAKPAAPQVKKSKAPSVASAKSVGAKPVTKAVAPRRKSVPPKPVVSSPAPAKATAAAQAPVPERVPEEITITVQADVGFGNQVFIRGEGAGLTWNSGVQLECAFDDQWTIKLTPVYGTVTFKLLLNDLTWSQGENYVGEPGANLVLTPVFG